MRTCAMIVRHADGTVEYRNYESYTAMKGDARDAERHGKAVLYWWCDVAEIRGDAAIGSA